MPDNTHAHAVTAVSRETLDQTPDRVLPILRAIGTRPAIRAAMNRRGYTTDDHDEGWRLLHAVSGFVEGKAPETIDAKVSDAIVELDRWDEDGFRIIRAALGRRHPDQAAFVLDGIGPSVGPAAVLGVKKLLERLDALEKGPERKATRKLDQAALATLAQRGLDAEERARLASLVQVAESVADLPAEDDGDRAKKDQAHVEGLTALRGWYEEWSEIARVAVKRRDYLILMGLAKRKPPKNGKAQKGNGKSASAEPKPGGAEAKPSTDAKPSGTDAKPSGTETKPNGTDAKPTGG